MIKIKYAITLIILISLVFSGCEKPMIGEPGSCRIGSSYKVNWDLSFTIDSIHEYRCPIPLMCAIAGDVDLYINFKRPFKSINKVLSLNNHDRNPVEIGDYTFRLLEVEPYPELHVEVDPKDYKIKMLIMKD